MKLQSEIGRLCTEIELTKKGDLSIVKTCVAIDNSFIYVTMFGSTADYIHKYGKRGGRILLKEWELEVKKINDKTVYDFTARRIEIIDFK